MLLQLSLLLSVLAVNAVQVVPHLGHDKRAPNSLNSFCADFNRLCISTCAGTRQPTPKHGPPPRTQVEYKCDQKGGHFYDFGCICDGHDISVSILDGVATAKPSVSYTTVTETIRTVTVHKTATATVTQVGTITAPNTVSTVRSTTSIESVVSTAVISLFTTVASTSTSVSSLTTINSFIGGKLPSNLKRALPIQPADQPNKRMTKRYAPLNKNPPAAAFCNVYTSSCASLCGGSSDVRDSECADLGEETYELYCLCRNGRDNSLPALYDADKEDSVVVKTITHDVLATTTATTTKTLTVHASTTLSGSVITTVFPTAVIIPEVTTTSTTSTVTTVIPFATINLISPTGIILVQNGTTTGCMSKNLVDGFAAIYDSNQANAMHVVLAEAANDGSVFVYALDDQSPSFPFIGGCLTNSGQPFASVIYVAMAYSPRGVQVSCPWTSANGEVPIFAYDPSSGALTTSYVDSGNNVLTWPMIIIGGGDENQLVSVADVHGYDEFSIPSWQVTMKFSETG